MATLYSSLFDSETNAYKGPVIEVVGGSVMIYGTITDAIDSTDSRVLLFPMVAGAKVIEFSIKAGSDLNSGNDFTFDLGYTSATAGFLDDSTGLQAAVVVTEAPTDTFAVTAAVADDYFELNRVAGSLTAGTIYFWAKVVLPV